MPKKITDLDELPSADSTDVMEIVDISTNTNKKVTTAGLAAAVTANTPDDTITPAMRSGGFKVVNYTFSGTGTKTITGVGFKPKGFLIFLRPQGTANTAPAFIGASDGTTTGGATIASGTSAAANNSATATLIYMINSSGTTQLSADLTSIDSDGITMNVTTNTGASSYVQYTFIFFG